MKKDTLIQKHKEAYINYRSDDGKEIADLFEMQANITIQAQIDLLDSLSKTMCERDGARLIFEANQLKQQLK